MTEGMIERLARKWATEIGEHEDEPVLRNDARWWLNAIADEMAAVTKPRRYPPGLIARLRPTDSETEPSATTGDS